MTETLAVRPVKGVRPKVRLVAWTQDPYDIAVASARTCYAEDFVFVRQLTPKGERTRLSLTEALPGHKDDLDIIGDPRTQHEMRLALVEKIQGQTDDADTRDAVAVFADLARQRSPNDDRIAKSIYEAGHHTPFQHPTFVFALDDVSRNVVESFFHQHVFYNSEQQSQRYVRMKEAEVHVPASIANDPDARAAFDEAVGAAYTAYHDLRERLVESNFKVMAAIGRIKGQTDKQIRVEAEKKSQEMARYVVPIAAATRLYHTVSGIVLLRYARMAHAQNADHEATQIVAQMLDAVRAVDPKFLDAVHPDALPRESMAEWDLVEPRAAAPFEGDGTSTLLHATPDAEALVADVIREVTGSSLDDEALLARVLDPAVARVWNDTLNTWDHSPVLRALRHVHYTFRKRQSLTAYAQDQRHRMTPGTRPLVQRAVFGEPDVHVPDVIANDPGAKAAFDEAVRALWAGMRTLTAMGIPAEDCAYLLPNAANITYTQSGDLLSFIHKWRLRLCFNAQKEIFEAALDELRQVQEVHPGLTRYLGPPCSFVAARQPADKQDDVEACCPEGPRWCGVKVWKNFDAQAGKPKRPY